MAENINHKQRFGFDQSTLKGVALAVVASAILWFGGFFQWMNDGFFRSAVVCNEGEDILWNGNITEAGRLKLLNIIQGQGAMQHPKLFLNSGGGNAEAAENIANDIKRFGITTIIKENASCVSACGIVFAAGTNRIMHPGTAIGFHSEAKRRLNLEKYAVPSVYLERAYASHPKVLAELKSRKLLDGLGVTDLEAEHLVSIDPSFTTIAKVETRPMCDKRKWWWQ